MKKILIGVGIGVAALLILWLVFRDWSHRKDIAYLEGQLKLQETVLTNATAEWLKAREDWLKKDTTYQLEIQVYQKQEQQLLGNLDSLNTHVSTLESEYDKLQSSGASDAKKLANVLAQNVLLKEEVGKWQLAYKTQTGQLTGLQGLYDQLKGVDAAWSTRYAALEALRATLSKDLQLQKKDNRVLRLQNKGLKLLALVGGAYAVQRLLLKTPLL
jgi:hypothetical protein